MKKITIFCCALFLALFTGSSFIGKSAKESSTVEFNPNFYSQTQIFSFNGGANQWGGHDVTIHFDNTLSWSNDQSHGGLPFNVQLTHHDYYVGLIDLRIPTAPVDVQISYTTPTVGRVGDSFTGYIQTNVTITGTWTTSPGAGQIAFSETRPVNLQVQLY